MVEGAKVTDVAAVPAAGSYLFTATDAFTNETELILVRCGDPPGVRAWVNTCPHEAQSFDTGDGAPIRDGELVCPRHGSLFDGCTGACDNGPAAGTTLRDVEVTVEDGVVYLSDDDYAFRHGGGIDDDDEPSSTSHVSL
jgi:nitrite reductase/ring-hydroxylating ferredoxin subunit